MSGPPPRPATGPDAEPAIQSGGPRRVLVHAAIDAGGNLRVGPTRFRPSDRAHLDAFIHKLRIEGVPGPDPSSPMWGLGQDQLDQLQAELKPPSQFEVRGQLLGAFLEELGGRIRLPIQLSPEAQRRAPTVRLEATTGRLSLGAAIAYVLSRHGLVFEPRQSGAGVLSLVVLTREESKRPWPVGVEPGQFPGTVAPRLMAAARYQTNDMPLAEVIAVLARELQMEVLVDRAGLAERNIDPDKLRSTVQVPGGTLLAAIRKTLAPLGLRHELRLDEASRPFLWITAGEPTGPAPKAPADSRPKQPARRGADG